MLVSRKREIRIKADSFREHCRVGKYGIIDLFRDCERMNYKLLRYPLGENADLGFTIKRDDDVVIFTNSCSRLSREIFTLAHEIGHVQLHLNDNNTFIDNTITINERSSDEKEQEANYFAACLLMPEDEVNKFIDFEISDFPETRLSAMDIAHIMYEFNVSFEMALNRLENLALIDKNEKICLDNEKIQKRVSKLLCSVGGNSKLNESCAVIDMPHEYIDYVIYNYNHGAVPEETVERVLDCYGLSPDDVSDRMVVHADEEDDLNELIGGLDD